MILAAHEFEDIELLVPIVRLSEQGAYITVATLGWDAYAHFHARFFDANKPITERFGSTVRLEKSSNRESAGTTRRCTSCGRRITTWSPSWGASPRTKCGSEMKVIAVIQESEEIRRIFAHPGRMAEQHAKRAPRLVKIGRSPPGFDHRSLN